MSSARKSTPVPAHVLIVDDNSVGLSARKVVMEELGYRVATAATPTEALDRLSKERFDIVITDYKLPAMNGAELICRMRKMEVTTPAILISGFVDALGLNERNTGADIVIQKSANEVAHMLRSVRTLLKEAVKKPPVSQRPPRKARRANA